MFNFLAPNLNPIVTANSPYDDYYAPDNLISNDVQKSSLGYMAYAVVKPPVYLDFELVCSIDLQCIKLWPKLGSLKSTGFEIHVARNSKSQFIKIAQCSGLQEDGIVFVHNHQAAIEKKIQPNFKVYDFYRANLLPLKQVKFVRIRITETTRCPPVLKQIEIWGFISSRETNENREKVYQLNNASLQQPVCDNEVENKLEENSESTSESTNEDNDEFPVPEEFLDSLTYEIMALPMVLPCGKTIDQLTLLRHQQEEEKFGRPPSDPFTGQWFTQERKPVLNAALKAQIDRFLLKNAHEKAFESTPRTVGTVSNDSMRKRHYVVGACSSAQASSDETKRLKKSTESNTAESTMAAASTSRGSLDAAVQLALKNVTRYSRPIQAIDTNDSCRQCNQPNINSILYQIQSCLHIICKPCLTKCDRSKCSCGTEFKNSEVQRYHKRLL